jgi:hypothetical protein
MRWWVEESGGQIIVRPRNFSIASTALLGASDTQAASRKVLSKSPGKCSRMFNSIKADLTTECTEGRKVKKV